MLCLNNYCFTTAQMALQIFRAIWDALYNNTLRSQLHVSHILNFNNFLLNYDTFLNSHTKSELYVQISEFHVINLNYICFSELHTSITPIS